MYPCMPLRASKVACCSSVFPHPPSEAASLADWHLCRLYLQPKMAWLPWGIYTKHQSAGRRERENLGPMSRFGFLTSVHLTKQTCKHKKNNNNNRGPAGFLSEDVVPESISVFQFQSILSAQIKYSGGQLKMMSLSRSCPSHSVLHRRMHVCVCVCERIR